MEGGKEEVLKRSQVMKRVHGADGKEKFRELFKRRDEHLFMDIFYFIWVLSLALNKFRRD